MKRLVVCCDGTWNELDFTERPITNVAKIAQAVYGRDSAGTQQIVYYDEGVGTLEGEKFEGGVFGDGLQQNILDVYLFLILNYEPGDEIYIFGFSRGAYTARSLAGLIRCSGIIRRDQASYIGEAFRRYESDRIHPNHPASVRFRQKHGHPNTWIDKENERDVAKRKGAERISITYLGVWDTVGTLGVLGPFNAAFDREEDHGFHDVWLSSSVKSARHAVALDETRPAFRATLWNTQCLHRLNGRPSKSDDALPYQQRWFPGDHGSVGGGGDITGLSDFALKWVADGGAIAGLAYDEDFEYLRHEISIRTGRKRNETKIITFRPDKRVGLKNTTQEWKRPIRGFFQGIKSVAMNAGGPVDRVEQCKGGSMWLSDIANSYNKQNYKTKLNKRMKKFKVSST